MFFFGPTRTQECHFEPRCCTHGARQSPQYLLKRIHNVMSTIPFSLGNVNASQAEKLNRLQKAFAGQASGKYWKTNARDTEDVEKQDGIEWY